MIRVGLARTRPSYQGIQAPYHPGAVFPELASLLGDRCGEGPPNTVYAAARAALAALGLDEAHFGSAAWNPLGALVRRGGRVVLKPNFIRHWNPTQGATHESVVTHGSVIRALLDYATLAVGADGSVALAEAPQQDCDWARVTQLAGLPEIQAFYEDALSRDFEAIDLRREAVETADGVIVARKPLRGDPLGYRAVDLGRASFFEGSGLEPARMRGADYDPSATGAQHSAGRNAYLLSETVLRADLIVNLPKLKTHKKTGVTLALKNLVGINGDKNWLPHHTVGAQGDEFPGGALVDRLRSRAVDVARGWLARGRATGLLAPRAPAGMGGARRRVHPQRQLARESHHVAHGLRSQPRTSLFRRGAAAARRAGARAPRAHRARRNHRRRRRGPARTARSAARRDRRGHRPGRGRSHRAAPDGLRLGSACRRSAS